MGAQWLVEHVEGTAQELQDLEVVPRRVLRVNRVNRPAIVLGARQGEADLPGTVPAGVDVAHRRTGGATMWLAPGAQVWIDLVVPRDDPLHSDDITVASRVLGGLWAAVLGAPASVRASGMSAPGPQAIACFAGTGPGEVVVGNRKLVGVSQRRTAAWARIQSVAYLRWDPAVLLGALRPEAPVVPGTALAEAIASLTDRVAVLGDPLTDSPVGRGEVRGGVLEEAVVSGMLERLGEHDVAPLF